jgi:hypothetical protein
VLHRPSVIIFKKSTAIGSSLYSWEEGGPVDRETGRTKGIPQLPIFHANHRDFRARRKSILRGLTKGVSYKVKI